MAREIVITSVPRGVKLGRTGFQVAMQTAGLRDDLASQLEKMAGYRHLPTGVPNPVCFFHRITKTFAGQVSVLGRIVDAGVDFSNRSNKLAHMVVLEAADVGQVAAASPAAVLAAIEGRLASTWPGPPEERREPFALAGIPASQAARCALWQQVMGDAGWAGVLAERAVRGQPTLVIGPDSSPATCRRMLALFQEALAVVPAAKRWGVTFDTTSLSPEGLLWRGTYAGSPESQAAQPGVLVVDLSRPQPIPQNLAAGDLVTIAREGPPVPIVPRPGAGGSGSQAPPVPGGGQPSPSAAEFGNAASGGRPPQSAGSVPGGAPPPAPMGSHDVFAAGRSGRTERKSYTGLIVGLVLGFALLTVVGGGGIYVFLRAQARHRDAIDTFRAYADDDGTKGAPAPNKDDLAIALGYRSGSDEVKAAEESLAFVNDWLKSEEGGGRDVENNVALKKVFDAVGAVRIQTSDKHRESLKTLFPGREVALYQRVANAHANGYRNWEELRREVALATIWCYAGTKRNAAPNAVDYGYALGLAAGPEGPKEAAATAAFMNGFLSGPDVKEDDVATPDKLKVLWEAVRSLQAERPSDGRKRLAELVRNDEDKQSVNLLDEIHHQAFGSFDAFRQLASDVTQLRELVAVETTKRSNPDITPALWDVIVSHAGVTKAEEKSEDTRKKFAKSVTKDDIENGTLLARKINGKVRKARGSPTDSVSESKPLPDGLAQLRSSIKQFRAEGRDVTQEIVKGSELLKWNDAVNVMARVGQIPGEFEPVINDNKVVVSGSDVVLAIEVTGSNVRVVSGDHWDKYQAYAKFMPIAFAKRPLDQPEKDDWIRLSPPTPKQMSSDGKALYHLLCTDQSVSLKVPDGLSVDQVNIVKEFQVGDGQLVVQLRRPTDLPLLVEITGTIAGRSYTLAEAIKFDRDSKTFDRQILEPWGERKTRFGKLFVDDPKLELIRIGFKDGEPSDDWQNSESNFEAMVSALLGRKISASEWERLRDAWCGYEKPKVEESKTGAARRDYPKTVEKWRAKLQDFLVGRESEGFAADAMARYRQKHQPRGPDNDVLDSDPREFTEPDPGKGKPEHDQWLQRKNKHQGRKSAWDKWYASAREDVGRQVRSADALRAYRGTGWGNANRDSDSVVNPNSAAVKVLLELDGLIVAKVFRDKIEALLKRIPVESLVEGTVKPREWWIDGLGGETKGKVEVVEAKLTPAAIRPLNSSAADEVAGMTKESGRPSTQHDTDESGAAQQSSDAEERQ